MPQLKPITALLGVLLALPLSASALQQNIEFNDKTAGYTWKQEGDQIQFVIDKQRALNTIQARIDEKDIDAMPPGGPVKVAAIDAGIEFVSAVLDAYFEAHPDVQSMHASVYLHQIGMKENALCYEFDYDRNQYTSLSQNFVGREPKTFISAIPTFTLSPWCQKQIKL